MSLTLLNISSVIFESEVTPTVFLPAVTVAPTTLTGGVTFASDASFLSSNLRFQTRFSALQADPPAATSDPPIGVYDPPFPPTYPILFSTDLYYGRDSTPVQLSMVRGDTFSFRATCAYSVTNDPVNLVGASVKFTAKYNPEDSEAAAVFQKTTANGIVIENPTEGIIAVTLQPADTNVLPNYTQILWCDIQVTDAANQILTVLRGRLKVLSGITTS